MQLNKAQVMCLTDYRMNLMIRNHILELLTVVDHYDYEPEIQNLPEPDIDGCLEFNQRPDLPTLPIGRIVRIDDRLFYCAKQDLTEGYTYLVFLKRYGTPVMWFLDTFECNANMIQNWNGDPAITTVGRYIENFVMFVNPFHDKVAYRNREMNDGDLAKIISHGLLGGQFKVPAVEKMIDNVFFLNHMTELCTPSMTPKSLMTSPKSKEFKEKYIKEHADEMNNPLVAKGLEDGMKKLDREWLGDDPSVRFFDGLGSRSYDIHRKKLFMTVGCVDAFDDIPGRYDFIPNSLSEGWTKEAFPIICNELRKSSYSRGTETAKGGADTKLLMRVFQDLQIIEDDCGSKKGLLIDFSKYDVNKFIGRAIINADGSETVITEENMSKFSGKICVMRSPQYCNTKDGLCFRCFGQQYKTLNNKVVGSQTINISSTYMNLAMKNMHGTALKTIDVELSDFLL